MSIGKSQAAQAPTALGSLLQASTYGATIPTIYGMTMSPLLAIWAANLRQGGSNKKFKQLKKGITAYVENIDFLLGSNPIIGVNQLWNNGATIPLNFVNASSGGTAPYVLSAPPRGKIQIGEFTVNSTPDQPDPNFYSVVGVSVEQSYSVTFDDYGGTGPVTLSGNYQVPCWNELIIGPDPTHGSALRNFPFCYRWQPSYGPFIFFDFPDFFTGNLTVYYTQVTPATSNQGPLLHNRLVFEPQLGSGSEYADAGDIPGTSTPYSTQQVIFDMYAGIGSSEIDLGSGGVLPSLTAEVQGKFSLYSTGDGDFADMIEDVFKSGVAQAAIGAGASTSRVEHGLSCYSYPGCIQVKQNSSVESFTQGPQSYNLPVTEGNYLIVIGSTLGIGGSALSVSDSLSNTWIPLFSTSFQQAWYAKANASGSNAVTFTGLAFDWHTVLIEVAGVDTLDMIATANANGQAVVTTTNVKGQPGYLLSVSLYGNGADTPNPIPLWNAIGAPNAVPNGWGLEERIVYSPGTFSLTLPTGALLASCIIAFKNSNPPAYPMPVGDFIDIASLNQVRLQCRANGLIGSLAMTSQQAASDWLKTLYDAADAAAVYMGFKLYSQPYSEVSAVGNGATYIAPTAAGPTFNLTTQNGDFIASNEDPPIKISTSARVDQPNVLQMQCINRTSNYNPSVVEQPDAASISLFGIRKQDPIINNAVQDVQIARQLLAIQVRKLQYGGDGYSFTLPAKYCLFAPMGAGAGGNSDAVITITDPLASLPPTAVRITSITEQSDQTLECEADPFIYGMYAPSLSVSISGTDTPTPYVPNPNLPVGLGINPPIIFEATPRLAQQTSPAQIWIVTSCQADNYGGCVPYISTDGGLSYNLASDSPIIGSAAQGKVTVDFPAASDPDTTDDLIVDVQISNAALASYTAQQRDKFQFPAYVGYSYLANAAAEYTVGDTSQITSLGMLFSNPELINGPLPSDATIINIFPVMVFEAITADPTATSEAWYGTGMTATSGGTVFFGPSTGVVNPPLYINALGGISIGTSLVGQQLRYAFSLPTNGGIASTGRITFAGWAILYSSATPNVDNTFIPPSFALGAGQGWAWAMPSTVTTGMVGSGTNASISGAGGIPPDPITYEIITYNDAVFTGDGNYTITGTGTGNAIRRGVYGAPSPGVGMDHPFGSNFGMLLPGDTGIVKLNMDPTWIGTPLWFKFPTYNTFGGSLQPLSDADEYTYTPTGIPGNIGPSSGILVNNM
jgi:Putative phage tail protein